MKKLKKNYMISADCVALLDYVSKTLNVRQGELIETLISHYAADYCTRCMTRPAFMPTSIEEKLNDLQNEIDANQWERDQAEFDKEYAEEMAKQKAFEEESAKKGGND